MEEEEDGSLEFPFVTVGAFVPLEEREPRNVEFLPVTGHGSVNTSSGNETANKTCLNDYCLPNEDYVLMIHDYIFPSRFEWVIVLMYLVVFVTGLIGNFLVCFVVWRNRQMRTVTNFFIVNLSVADFLVILICLPPTVVVDITETWFLGRVLCKIVHYLQSVSVSVSVLTLTVISVERFYAICYPLKFRSTKSRARIMILAVWIVSLAILIPELIVLDLSQRFPATLTDLLTSCKPSWSYNQQATYQLFLSVAMFFAPLGLMAFTYIRIAVTLWQNVIPSEPGKYGQTKSSSSGNYVSTDTVSTPLTVAGGVHFGGGGGGGRAGGGLGAGAGRSEVGAARTPNDIAVQMAARRNVAKMLIAVVWMFGICYLPVHLLNVLRYFQVGMERHAAHFALIAHWLCYFNSAINPVIYNFMSAKFRKEFSDACLCCRGCFLRQRENNTHPRNVNHSYSAYRCGNSVTQTENISMTKVVTSRFFRSAK